MLKLIRARERPFISRKTFPRPKYAVKYLGAILMARLKASIADCHFLAIHFMYGDLLCSTLPSTANNSLSHCHNRNLHVFFAQKQYLNHWYSQYIDAFIEGGDIADTCIFVWWKHGDTAVANTGSHGENGPKPMPYIDFTPMIWS